jgi:hypothetical protein
MIVDDFIMLGRTVPEHSKKHGLVVCSAGYSRELRQFMRVYPITMFDRIPRWSQCRLALRRPNDDSRLESWRINEDIGISVTGENDRANEFAYLSKRAASSIKELNEKRQSLGIIKPQSLQYRFGEYRDNETFMLDLFGNEQPKPLKPRVVFDDDDGKHDLQLRDWGSHEFLRKNQASPKLWDALKFTDKRYNHLLFVGNHNQHRSSWLVISVISQIASKQMDLLECA